MVLARLSEWTLGKEKEKRRPGPSPILQLCLGGTPAFGSGSSRRSFIQGKQRAAGCTGSGRIGDPVREWGDAGISGGAIEGEDRSAEPEFSLRCPA